MLEENPARFLDEVCRSLEENSGIELHEDYEKRIEQIREYCGEEVGPLKKITGRDVFKIKYKGESQEVKLKMPHTNFYYKLGDIVQIEWDSFGFSYHPKPPEKYEIISFREEPTEDRPFPDYVLKLKPK